MITLQNITCMSFVLWVEIRTPQYWVHFWWWKTSRHNRDGGGSPSVWHHDLQHAASSSREAMLDAGCCQIFSRIVQIAWPQKQSKAVFFWYPVNLDGPSCTLRHGSYWSCRSLEFQYMSFEPEFEACFQGCIMAPYQTEKAGIIEDSSSCQRWIRKSCLNERFAIHSLAMDLLFGLVEIWLNLRFQ